MKKIQLLYLFGIVMFFAFLSSCIKEEFDLDKLVVPDEWAPEIAFPLVHSKLSVEDILAHGDNSTNNNLSEEQDGLMLLVYRDTLFSVKATNYINFPVGFGIIPDYTGTHILNLPVDSVGLNLEIYNNLVNGSFSFENPKMHVIVTNSIGIPIDISLGILESWSPINGTNPIFLDLVSAPIPLNPSPGYPLVPGNSVETIYSYDKTNSNLSTILTTAPKYIRYSVEGIVNPLPQIFPNFITDSSQFNVEIKLELPLHGSVSFLTLGDTIPFNLDVNDPSGNDAIVTEAVFVINTYNDFPVDIIMQLLFLDSNQTIIDSLYYTGAQNILSSALIGPPPALRTYERTHKVTEIPVTKDRLDRISQGTDILIKGQFTSSKGGIPLVKVYSDYQLEVKLAVRAKLKLGNG